MITEYDKAIAGFLTAAVGLLAAFNVQVAWINPGTIAAITPFLTMVVVWLVPNKRPVETATLQPAASPAPKP